MVLDTSQVVTDGVICSLEALLEGSPHFRGSEYSETSDKGHYEREQTSQQRTSRKYFCIIYRKSPLKEDNLSTKDKTAGPEGVFKFY